MKNLIFSLISFALLGFCACSEDSNPSQSNSQNINSSVEAGIVGTWIRNPGMLVTPDTIVFGSNSVNTPFFNAIGYSAMNGLLKVGPGSDLVGEYLHDGDTLFFEPLFGDKPVPQGINRENSAKYLRSKL